MKASKSLWSALLSWFLLSSTQDESKNTIEIKEKFLDSTPPTSNLSDNPAKITEFAFSFRSQNYFTKLTQKTVLPKTVLFLQLHGPSRLCHLSHKQQNGILLPKAYPIDPVVSNLRVFHISNPYLFHFLIV